jgi:putative ABC transport system permease protein
MMLRDLISLSGRSISSQRQRTLLTGLGIAIGIAAVVILTAIGQGLKNFVIGEFTQFGTHLLAITAGKSQTHGQFGVFGNTRPLTLDDASAITHVPGILGVVPFVQGNAQIEAGSKQRRTFIYGVGPAAARVWQMSVAQGTFLPDDAFAASRAYAVLGHKAWQELYGGAPAVGTRLRMGGSTFRVIGVMHPKGSFVGFDIDDSVYIPTASAMDLFNRESLMEIDVLYADDIDVNELKQTLKTLMIQRHGREDVTIIDQAEMLDTLGNILNILTVAVAAIGGISLLVGAVGIVTVMTINVSERTREIGVMRAIGASRGLILTLFLSEAISMGGLGGVGGLLLGVGTTATLSYALPSLPVHIDWLYAFAALASSMIIGAIAGMLPAWRAARLDPVAALRGD